MEKWIVIVGHYHTGFKFYGPFETEPEAIGWAESEDKIKTWFVVPLLRGEGKPKLLPTVVLHFEHPEGSGIIIEKLYYADLRLKEYRSTDGSAPWVVPEEDVSAPMEDVIEEQKGG